MTTTTKKRRTGGRAASEGDAFAQRIAAADWEAVTDEVNDSALLPQLLTPAECADIAKLYGQPELFWATINMQRHRFGSGEYRYFVRPFPEAVQRLREELYPRLLPIARDWYDKLGRQAEWPDSLEEWLEICHQAGQERPAPILLSKRGWSAAPVRRGVSAIRSGRRHTLGLVFHDAT